MKVLVLAAGDPISPSRLRPHLPFDLVIAADGGAHQANGIDIDLLIGDLDSIDRELLNTLRHADVTIEPYPADKDATDLELAIGAASARGATELVVAGGGGGRLDHLLGNAAVVSAPRAAATTWVLEDSVVYPVHDRRRITVDPGATVSVLAAAGDASGVTLTGLRWPLAHEVLLATSSLGVSNVAEGDSITVTVAHGIVLVIVNDDAGT